MYTLGQIKQGFLMGLESPNLFLREANRIYYTRKYGPGYNHAGIDIFEEEWDTLVILDACRFDMFLEQRELPGTLEKRTSRGSHTAEFLRGNFDNRTVHDTVYTTATPQLERRRDRIDVEFHTIKNVWNSTHWDDDEGTVLPNVMTNIAIESHEEYPNKRHVVHYMQPHYPFIGSDIDENSRGFHEQSGKKLDFWNQLMRGRIQRSPSEVWKAYRQNFNLAIEAVEKLLESDAVDGRIIITSDHGNMIGERATPVPVREWGHPTRLYTEELVTVPWLIQEGEKRREITASKGVPENKVENKVVEERLEDLGYV